MPTKKAASAKGAAKKRGAKAKGTCFVVMGFGKKTDFESGRTLDLDKTYRNIIKPAVEAAGLECRRADDVIHSGPIEVPMYEELLNADVVVADLSTSNRNAYYELGVRHALKPYTTVIICEDGDKNPAFDVRNIRRLPYHHMGEGIDFDEVQRVRKQLEETIAGLLKRDPRPEDSPVYTFLKNLRPPQLAEAIEKVAAAAEAAMKARPRGGDGAPPASDPRESGGKMYGELMEEADKAQKADDFVSARALLKIIRERMEPGSPEYSYVTQRLALVTYKSRQPTPKKALEEARALLLTLNPETSNDTETLGLWGAVHKRLWDETKDGAHLDEAVRGYERGFYLRNDYYNGINLAYLLNVRAANARSRAEAIADFVQAERVRREVLAICEDLLKQEKQPKAARLSDNDRYWVLATVAEAYLGIGDEARAEEKFKEAVAVIPNPKENKWMKESTQEQMDKLRALLAKSPLKYIKAGRP